MPKTSSMSPSLSIDRTPTCESHSHTNRHRAIASIRASMALRDGGSVQEKYYSLGRQAQAGVPEGEWTQAARGIVGRANVRLCHASSYIMRIIESIVLNVNG